MADQSHSRKYRNWSKVEDEKLVEALVMMVTDGGYKADNGFKSGFSKYLEQTLKAAMPGTDILAKPHIESRIKTFKKDWQIVHDMLHGTNTCGFGYDNVKGMVTAEDPVWDAYLEAHKEATKWRNKPFPHYDDLCFVFGKDRAHGHHAKDHEDLDENPNTPDDMAQEHELDDDVDIPIDTSFMPNEEFTSRGCRKRKRRGDPIVDTMTNAFQALGDLFHGATNNLIKVDLDMHEKKAKLTSELDKMDSLSEMERYKAFQHLTRDSDDVLYFWNLKEDRRERFVRMILNV